MMGGRKTGGHQLCEPGLRLYFRLIALASIIVPSHFRADWRKEWETEIWYYWAELKEWRRLSFETRLRLLNYCTGSVRDALSCRLRGVEEARLVEEIRSGLQTLCKRPALSIAALMALALSIGANSLIFAISHTLLCPLPFENPDRLVRIWDNFSELNLTRLPSSVPEYVDFRNQNQVFSQIAAYKNRNVNLMIGEKTIPIQSTKVTTEFFSLLGTSMVNGRAFTESEEEPGKSNVAVLSYRLWHDGFAGDPHMVGRAIALNGESYTVVGIAATDFDFPGRTDLWTPIVIDRGALTHGRASRSLNVIARLSPNRTIADAQNDMDAIARRLQVQYVGNYTEGMGWHVTVASFQEQFVGGYRPVILTLSLAVGFILLIAAMNVANLLLTAAEERRITHLATGGSRRLLIRQSFIESMLIAIIGGSLGLFVAICGIRLLIASSPESIEWAGEIHFDVMTFYFTGALSLLTGFALGLTPALLTLSDKINGVIRQSLHAVWKKLHCCRMQGTLMTCQVALSLIFLIGAGITIQSFLRLWNMNPGFDEKNLLTMRISLSEYQYSTNDRVVEFYREALRKAASLPEIESAGAINSLPFTEGRYNWSLMMSDHPPAEPKDTPCHELRAVSPNYFQVMGIPLLRGDHFTEADPPAVIINEAMASRYWPGGDPIGKQIKLLSHDSQPWRTIVGVVGDIRVEGPDKAAEPEIYLPYYQFPLRSMTLVLRTGASASNIESRSRELFLAIDKDQPVYKFETMEEIIGNSLSLQKYSTLLLGLLAAMALILFASGIHSLMCRIIDQNRREIGIRIALGAQPGDVRRLVLAQGFIIMLTGISVGLAATLPLIRWMPRLLPGVSAVDPIVYLNSVLLLTAVAGLSIYISAHGATKSNAVDLLRSSPPS
jgi:putative ABC transport system permease protein